MSPFCCAMLYFNKADFKNSGNFYQGDNRLDQISLKTRLKKLVTNVYTSSQRAVSAKSKVKQVKMSVHHIQVVRKGDNNFNYILGLKKKIK